MLPGTRARVLPCAVRRSPRHLPATQFNGGYIFAEDPALAAPNARIVWQAELDAATLLVSALPGNQSNPDTLDLARLREWMTIVVADDGTEHITLSDGWHHVRLDVEEGTFTGDTPTALQFRLVGIRNVERPIRTLRRFIDLYTHGRFSASLFPRERRMSRWLTTLRVHDALEAGASHREIAAALFGEARVQAEWGRSFDALRSHVRRLATEARAMARGGYRSLLRRG